MTVDEVYNLYNRTFATKKDDDTSFYAFRRMLHEFGIIDNELYLNLSSDEEGSFINECVHRDYYYFINEGDIPELDSFLSNDFGFKSDVIRILTNINHIIIKTEDGSEILYNKVLADNGIPYWEKIIDNSQIIKVDSQEMTSIICYYIIDMQYNYIINDDYLNINVSKFNKNDEEISDKIKNFTNWFFIIFDTKIIDSDNWKKFIPFIEDAGIIDAMTKSRILSDSTTASF